MNKTVFAILVAFLTIFSTGCKAQNKTLVAYFSATGTTAAVAKNLAAAAEGADLFEIAPVTPYTSEDLDWRNKNSRSSKEMTDQKSRPEIKDKIENISQYSTIFIGFPIWWGTAPRIINTFLESYDFSGKTVILFATSGSSTIDQADLLVHKAYPGLNWKAGRRLNNADEATLKKFAEASR